jgi:hypothetical protein
MQIQYRYRPPKKPKLKVGVMNIKPYRSWICPLLIVLCIIIMGAGGLFLWERNIQDFRKGRQVVIAQQLEEIDKARQVLEQAFQKNTTLEQQKADLIVKNKALQDKLATTMHTTQIDQKTYTQVLQSLNKLQVKNSDLKEELVFYQRLLTSPNLENPVEVSNFTLNNDNGLYPYKLVLTQLTRALKLAEGTIKIQLIGEIRGKTKRLKMKEITKNAINSLRYQLLYFQRIENKLMLPKGFKPRIVIIRLLPKDQEYANEVHFKWENLSLKKEQKEYVGKS